MVESSKTRRRDDNLAKEASAAKKMKMSNEDISAVGEKLVKGDIPSTDELKQVIDQAKGSMSDQDLSTQGKRLAVDIQQVLDSSKKILDKNKGEKLQNFFNLAAEFGKEVEHYGEKLGDKAEDEQYKAMKEARELFSNIQQAIVFSLQSVDFRGLLSEYVDLMQNVAGMFKEAAKSGDSEKAKKAVEKASLSEKDKKELKEKFNSLMKRISQNKEFNEAFNNLFTIFNTLQRTFSMAKDEAKKPFESKSFEGMTKEVDSLVCEFCGTKDWNNFKQHFWQLIESIQNDSAASEFFQDFSYHIRSSLEKPSDITSGPVMRRGEELLDKAFSLMERGKDKYRANFRTLFSDMQTLLDNLSNDKSLTQMSESLGKLTKDLFTDSLGRPDIYVAKDSLIQLKNMFLPIIRDRLENIPLPKIEGSNDTYDYYVEGILFNGKDILPESFHMTMLNDVKMSQSSDNKMVTRIDVKIQNVKLEFKNMNFFYRRKVIPKIEDYGTANVSIGGDGLDLKLSWRVITEENKPIRMELAKAKCNIDALNIEVLDSKHSILDGIISAVFPGYIKGLVANAIVDKIKSSVESMDEQVNDMFKKQKELFDESMKNIGEEVNDKVKKSANWMSKWKK